MEILSDQIAARLLTEIVQSRYPPGAMLPSEGELAKREGVSRLTIREALKVLREKSVIEVQRGRGSLVTARDTWNPLDAAILRAVMSDREGFVEHMLRLYEVRQLVEVGTAELAAMRRTESQLAAIDSALTRSRLDRDDLELSIAADLEFHQAVMRAAGNPALARMFAPLEEALQEGRRRTSQELGARDRAIEAHERILEAIRTRSPERARWAMHEHLVEGVADLRANLEDADGSRLTSGAGPAAR